MSSTSATEIYSDSQKIRTLGGIWVISKSPLLIKQFTCAWLVLLAFVVTLAMSVEKGVPVDNYEELQHALPISEVVKRSKLFQREA